MTKAETKTVEAYELKKIGAMVAFDRDGRSYVSNGLRGFAYKVDDVENGDTYVEIGEKIYATSDCTDSLFKEKALRYFNEYRKYESEMSEKFGPLGDWPEFVFEG